MNALEVAGGWVNGYDRIPLPASAPADPRTVLDASLVRCLSRAPCFIAFSGGRDSSGLLAAAVAAARREGLAAPVPVTLIYPGVPGADESAWQLRVLDHLGITERIVLEVRDEHDPLGPIASRLLLRHGITWPPNLAPTWRAMECASGGVLLTGEGGDEVFGVKRITPLTKVIKGHGRADSRLYPHAVRALAPLRARRAAALRQRYRRPWLREPAEMLLARRDAEDAAASALHAGRHTWQLATRRCVRLAYETVRTIGADLDVEYVQPFQDPGFVAAMAAAAGWWGWTGRTTTMRFLFDEVLPREVLERQTKAVFNNALFSEHTRAFARSWDGTGVDPELVDPEVLRDNWLSDFPHAPSMALLHQAWLATRAAQPAIRG